MKKKFFLLILFFIFISMMQAISIVTFAPSVFQGTSSAQINAMNATLGITDYIIEDFEDTTMVENLLVGYDGNTPSGQLTSRLYTSGSSSYVNGIWDGTQLWYPDISKGPNVFQIVGGATSFGIGVGDVESDIRLYVNGVNYGLVRSLPNYSRSQDQYREIYIRIDAGLGELITNVTFLQPTASGDGIFYDHIAIAVPEPASLFFLSVSLLFFAFFHKKNL